MNEKEERTVRERQRFSRSYFKPKPVKLGDELEVTISEMSRRGDGLARVQGYVIFVPNTKQGDHVKIRITQVRPTHAVAQVV
ncbi:MAG: TRAM domain-containing protein [Nitrososphaerales archaeon]|nr:TRAM domain-containing protein [Nitrososphaerales archaeon]MCX8191501.1 TRAM domain-containing protein [Nitrososphaerales archaeon]